MPGLRRPLRWMSHDDEAALIQEFETLLELGCDEQVYQEFMERNTQLIPREFVQNHGIHFQIAFRKPAFGADYKCDFLYMSKSSADWNCIIIEIEKPQSRYFTDKGRPHRDLLTALDQIHRWRVWMSKPANQQSFLDALHYRFPLQWNPCYFKYVLVFGRRREFRNSELRRSYIREFERDDFKIVTFDSLVEDLLSKRELYIAVRKNEHIEIVSEKFVSELPFEWMDPEMLRITEALRADVMRNDPSLAKKIAKIRSIDQLQRDDEFAPSIPM